jgi:NTE family protein/lysophospholipid hydrolase
MTTSAVTDLVSFLSQQALFEAVPQSILNELAPGCEFVSLADGEILVQEGDAGDSLYLVASGRLLVPAVELGPGQIVGELGFLTGCRRSATVRALGEACLLRIARAEFDRVAGRHPQSLALVTARLVERLRRTQLSRALRASHLFRSLDEAVLNDLEAELELIVLPGGETLFRQGEPGDCLCVVIGGMVRVVVRRSDGEERVIAESGAGETVGEMAVLGSALGNAPRSATVTAVRDTHLARLTLAGYERLLAKHPVTMARLFTAKVVARLAAQISGSTTASRVPATIAVIPAGPGIALAEFCARFRESLAVFGETVHLDAARVDEALGKPGIAQTRPDEVDNLRLVEWLADREATHRHVIYQADCAGSPWSRRAVRQADRILIVADPSADPAPGEFETQILRPAQTRTGTPAELILLYSPPDRKPYGTRRWLSGRSLERHHHVTLASRGDFDRVARFLTGHAIGLVLGGGFARGLAHSGVIRALEEIGIPVDIVGGTSMGSIMAGGFAMGFTWARLLKLVSEGGAAAFRDLTVPLLSLLTGKKLAQSLHPHIQDLEIEDLRIPYFCISASLKRAAMHVHTRGSLFKSVLASSRAPGAFPPLFLDDDLLNNVPVDVMKQLSNGGVVIAVDVSPAVEPLSAEDYGVSMSGWRVLWQKISPRSSSTLPTVFNVLMRIIAFSGVAGRENAAQLADVYLHPPLEQFKINDFERGDEMAEAAYVFAKPILQEWWAAFNPRAARDTPRVRPLQ